MRIHVRRKLHQSIKQRQRRFINGLNKLKRKEKKTGKNNVDRRNIYITIGYCPNDDAERRGMRD